METTTKRYEPHPHQPANVNMLIRLEHKAASINQRIAVVLTQAVGTMVCAYIFAALAIAGFPGFSASLPQYIQWISQTLIQLVMLSVIMVGQRVLGRHQEVQVDEQFKITQKIYTDMETIIAQNNHLLTLLGEKDVNILDETVDRILYDLNNAIRQCKTVEEAQQLIWKIASREEMK